MPQESFESKNEAIASREGEKVEDRASRARTRAKRNSASTNIRGKQQNSDSKSDTNVSVAKHEQQQYLK